MPLPSLNVSSCLGRNRQTRRRRDRTQITTLGSVPGITTHPQPASKALYAQRVVIGEIYSATESVLGQQRDVSRAWVPNYDRFFFEVQTRSGVNLLHEMRPGEMGSLVVSTPILPRY
jgi:hypothetical protein